MIRILKFYEAQDEKTLIKRKQLHWNSLKFNKLELECIKDTKPPDYKELKVLKEEIAEDKLHLRVILNVLEGRSVR